MSPGDQLMPHRVPDSPALPWGAEEGTGQSGRRARQGCSDTTGPRLGLAQGSCHASGDGDSLGCRSLASRAVVGELGELSPHSPVLVVGPSPARKRPWGDAGMALATKGSAAATAEALAAAGYGHGLFLAVSAGAMQAVAMQHEAPSCVCWAGTESRLRHAGGEGRAVPSLRLLPWPEGATGCVGRKGRGQARKGRGRLQEGWGETAVKMEGSLPAGKKLGMRGTPRHWREGLRAGGWRF